MRDCVWQSEDPGKWRFLRTWNNARKLRQNKRNALPDVVFTTSVAE